MRKHQYTFTDAGPYGPYVQCMHCGRLSTLDIVQLKALPRNMARCPSPRAPRVGIIEWLVWCVTGSIDCWFFSKRKHK